jgi:hypothetical protein
MALIKLSNNGVKNITSVGSVGTGELKFISKQTASSSASISFTSGIDSTYKEYIFYFVNIHPATNNVTFGFQANASGGSGYNETITSSFFSAYHNESDSATALQYDSSNDQAQGTSFQALNTGIGNDNDQCKVGYLHLFNPSSTTFVKHFISTSNNYVHSDYSQNDFIAGYFNTTSAIDEIQFKMSSGNIDSGDILLYGVN